MAYPLPLKGRAMALLLTGESISSVRKMTGVPPRTLRRWREQAFAMAVSSLKETPDGRQFLASIRQLSAALRVSELGVSQLGGREKMSAFRRSGKVVIDIGSSVNGDD